jgi:predicted phage gp36 major capsid-like protein
MTDPSDAEKFDAGVRKILSVSREELKRREEEWKRNQADKKRAKASPASRASSDKG